MTPTQVWHLKKDLFVKKIGTKELQSKYNISAMQISRIARGVCWPEILPKLNRGTIVRKTSDVYSQKILKDLKKGTLKQKDIAIKYNVSPYVVTRIKKKLL